MIEALWWTINGWVLREQPCSYSVVWAGDEDTTLDAAFRDAGYSAVGTWRLSLVDYDDQLEVYRHRAGDNHLVVLFGEDEHFFVERTQSPAFWADKFPALLNLAQMERRTEAAEQLTRGLLGFVRHGHGKHVIDERGEETMEERQRRQEEWRRGQAERERAKRERAASQQNLAGDS